MLMAWDCCLTMNNRHQRTFSEVEVNLMLITGVSQIITWSNYLLSSKKDGFQFCFTELSLIPQRWSLILLLIKVYFTPRKYSKMKEQLFYMQYVEISSKCSWNRILNIDNEARKGSVQIFIFFNCHLTFCIPS